MLGYLFAGYAVIWVLLIGYVLSLAGRQKRLAAQVTALKRAMESGRQSA